MTRSEDSCKVAHVAETQVYSGRGSDGECELGVGFIATLIVPCLPNKPCIYRELGRTDNSLSLVTRCLNGIGGPYLFAFHQI